jgi:hypothetical protein
MSVHTDEADLPGIWIVAVPTHRFIRGKTPRMNEGRLNFDFFLFPGTTLVVTFGLR